MELFERFAEFWLTLPKTVASAASMLEELSEALVDEVCKPVMLLAKPVSCWSKLYDVVLRFWLEVLMLARDASSAAEIDERLFELVSNPAMVVFIFASAASMLIEELERLLFELF